MRLALVVSDSGVRKFYPYTKVKVYGETEFEAYIVCTLVTLFECYASDCFGEHKGVLPIPRFIMELPNELPNKINVGNYTFNRSGNLYLSTNKCKNGLKVQAWEYKDLYKSLRREKMIYTNVHPSQIANWDEFLSCFPHDTVIFLDEVALTDYPELGIKVDRFLFHPYIVLDIPMPSENDVFLVNFSGRSGLFLLALSAFGVYAPVYVIEDNVIDMCPFDFSYLSDLFAIPFCLMAFKVLLKIFDKLDIETDRANLGLSEKLVELVPQVEEVISRLSKLSCQLFRKELGHEE